MTIHEKGQVHWAGDIKRGKGTISTESGALKQQPYGFNTRFEGAAGTNPEELIGAAHAGCFSMELSLISLEMAALKRLPHKTFGIFVIIEPAIVAIIAFFMFSEHFTFIQVIAIAFSITAGMGCAMTAGGKMDTLVK